MKRKHRAISIHLRVTKLQFSALIVFNIEAKLWEIAFLPTFKSNNEQTLHFLS